MGITHKGNFAKTTKFFDGILAHDYIRVLGKYGEDGVRALSAATPIDTGKTASSWYYEIKSYKGGIKIAWLNSNIVKGIPVALLIQYGHATRNGGYVQGRDYINPALRPIFDKMANDAWREVTKL